MTNETQMTGIGKMEGVEIGENSEFASIIANNVSDVIKLLELLANKQIMAIDEMKNGKIGAKAQFGAIIIKQQNLSEEKKDAIFQEVIKQVESDSTLKQRLLPAVKAGVLDELKKLPGGEVLVAIIKALLHPEPIIKQKQEQLRGSDNL